MDEKESEIKINNLNSNPGENKSNSPNNNANKSSGKLWIIVISILVVLVIALGIFAYFKMNQVASESANGVSESKVTNLFNNQQTQTNDKTLTEIISEAESEGTSACKNLEGDTKDECLIKALVKKGNTEGDVSSCESLQGEAIESCKRQIIFALVAIAYNNEKTTAGFTGIPSNIALCDKLDVQDDINYCKNPSQMVADCGGVFCYSI